MICCLPVRLSHIYTGAFSAVVANCSTWSASSHGLACLLFHVTAKQKLQKTEYVGKTTEFV